MKNAKGDGFKLTQGEINQDRDRYCEKCFNMSKINELVKNKYQLRQRILTDGLSVLVPFEKPQQVRTELTGVSKHWKSA